MAADGGNETVRNLLARDGLLWRTTMRITRDEYLMGCAILAAQRSTCLRAPLGVGAIVAKEGRIISTGYAGTPPGAEHCSASLCDLSVKCTRTIHAEDNAIRFARKYGVPLEGCTMYCTTSPCPECARIILESGISRLVYKDPYRDLSGLLSLGFAGVTVERYGHGSVLGPVQEAKTND